MSHGKIALFGCNNLGLGAAGRLNSRQHRFFLVDNDEARVKTAVDRGFDAILADYRDDEVLRSIGIGEDVDTIFCFFPEDSENVFLTISARALAPKLRIVSVVESPEAADKLRAAGADKIIDPYEVSGRKIYEIIKRPIIVDILDQTVYGRHDLKMAEVEIPEGCCLDQRRLSELQWKERYNLILLGVVNRERGKDLRFVTGGVDYKLSAGDVLVVLGPPQEIGAFKQEICVH
ncbi:MAG: TrkA family potassium uptake protein [Methylococcaceae bacterium]|nr:MAG: TrkA family potassium uptake protein [Methylococcaceae bacterium]